MEQSLRTAQTFILGCVLQPLVALVLVAVVSACTTGDNVRTIDLGMPKAAVVGQLGAPDGAIKQGSAEVLTYANRLMTGWSWDRADYHVILEDGVVSSYGPGTIRQSNIGGVSTLFIVPIR